MSEPEKRDGSVAPFVIAAAVAALVLIVVAVLTLTRGDRLTEQERVARAAVAQNDALQRQNYVDYQRYTCTEAQQTDVDFLAGQRDSAQRQGARYVDGVTNVKIDADRATGTVTYHFGNTTNDKRTTQLSFVRQDGRWKVCSDYK